MGGIHVLDKSIYELIAAGEVIERPSSAVKELVENAIDAGATSVVIEIKSGGKTYIRVTDNGCGMAKEDVPLAFVRHATSKIGSVEDLDNIATLGFRGEALASICAVSRVEVITKQKGDALGCVYSIEGGEQTHYDDIGCPDGTSVIVRDLFFNVPARQKYLKKDVTEANAIAATLQKLALSNPGVSIKFIRDNKLEFVTAGDGKLLSCIYTILGKEFYTNCIPVDYDYNGIKINGYITKPYSARANRSYQIFFVNSRYVKSSTCLYGLEEAYKGRIMTGKFPGCVLNLTIGSDLVDINSHPAKLEIRFQDEAAVHDAVYFAAKNALMLLDEPYEIEFSTRGLANRLTEEEIFGNVYVSEPSAQLTLNSSSKDESNDENGHESKPSGTFFSLTESMQELFKDYKMPGDAKIAQDDTTTDVHSDADNDVQYHDGESDAKPFDYHDEAYYGNIVHINNIDESNSTDSMPEQDGESGGFRFINSASFSSDTGTLEPDTDEIPPIRVIGEAFKTYIIAECGNDILFIDKHAAHEMYIYEQIRHRPDALEMQLLVDPISAVLPYETFDALSQHSDECKKLGFGIKFYSAPHVEIYGVPTLLGNDDPVDSIESLSDCFIKGSNDGAQIFDDLYHSIACKAAIKGNSDSTMPELEKLVELVTKDDLRYCPHGRPILTKLTKREIERMFKRIQ